ncbi:MAG: transposase [Thermoprotei archaeon]
MTRGVDRYYAFIQYESDEKLESGCGTVGLDMGITRFLAASDGIAVEPINAYMKFEKKLRRGHRRLSRKKRRSNSRGKASAMLR